MSAKKKAVNVRRKVVKKKKIYLATYDPAGHESSVRAFHKEKDAQKHAVSWVLEELLDLDPQRGSIIHSAVAEGNWGFALHLWETDFSENAETWIHVTEYEVY